VARKTNYRLSKAKHRVAALRFTIIFLGSLSLIYSIRGFSYNYVWDTVFFAACVTFAQIVEVTLPQGGSVSLGPAVIITTLLLFPFSNALTISVFGVLLSRSITSKLTKRSIIFPAAKVSFVAFVSMITFYLLGGAPFLEMGTDSAAKLMGWGSLPVLALVAIYFFLDLAIDEILFCLKKAKPIFSSWIGMAKLVGLLYLALSSLGVLFALLYPFLHAWSALFFFFPLILTRHAFTLNLNIRRTYHHTIRALSRAIEAQAPNRRGHAERVTEYSIGIAQELGVSGGELEKIAYAALLHDLGKLGLDEDSLDSLLESKSSWNGESPHAIVGAEILEQVDFLKEASKIVRMHHEPFEGSSIRGSDIPLGARIINVASRYDELTTAESTEERLNSSQAIARLKKEQGLSFDPQVIRGLINMLQRRGEILRIVS